MDEKGPQPTISDWMPEWEPEEELDIADVLKATSAVNVTFGGEDRRVK